MNLHDDPRLTAYALGELDDNECAEIEALLENNADTREELEIIRTTAHLLEVELQQEPVTQLTEEQRKEVEAAIGGTTKTATRSRGWKRVIWLSKFALAASFLHGPAPIAGRIIYKHSPSGKVCGVLCGFGLGRKSAAVRFHGNRGGQYADPSPFRPGGEVQPTGRCRTVPNHRYQRACGETYGFPVSRRHSVVGSRRFTECAGC